MRRSDLEKVCDENSCWETGGFEDPPVTVVLGDAWECLMADRHFSNKHKCLRTRKGGYCDGIAVHRQSAAKGVRLVEAKASGSVADARPQLRKGAELVVASGGERVAMSAECHTEGAPTNTLSPQRPLRAAGRLIPVSIFVRGVLQT